MTVVRASARPTRRGVAGQFHRRSVLGRSAGRTAAVAHARNGGFVHSRRRTGWHAHPVGQTLYCLTGVGRICIGKGSRPQSIYPGDTVLIPPNTLHWHGAAPDRLFSHLAMSETGKQGQGTEWGEHVTDVEYTMQPAAD